MIAATLSHIHGNTFRLTQSKDGNVIEVTEFTGGSICNGYNPFLNRINCEFKCDEWYVGYGKAQRPIVKLQKAIMQCPYGVEHW